MGAVPEHAPLQVLYSSRPEVSSKSHCLKGSFLTALKRPAEEGLWPGQSVPGVPGL